MHEWHWISSAVALMGLLFFAVTGITLNHASSLESTQQQFRSLDKDMPPALVAALVEDIRQNGEGDAPPTDALRDWIRETFGVDTANRNADWKAEEIMFTLERPGGDAWLRLDLVRGAGEYHVTDADWVAYLNDLHKGRHTGSGWSWFIDLIAAACAGLASGWLTHDAAIGAIVQARLRYHSQFRLDDNAGRDLILIGNSTGLAGLRAHLKQRALERHAGGPALRQWLLFGERQAAHDAPYAAEMAAWQASGVLTRLDLVYSRDGHAERYVQDRLRAQGERLREWVDAGAAIYVCGSLKGMAEGVAQVLREHLGEPLLAQLQQQGRYRRDVY